MARARLSMIAAVLAAGSAVADTKVEYGKHDSVPVVANKVSPLPPRCDHDRRAPPPLHCESCQ